MAEWSTMKKQKRSSGHTLPESAHLPVHTLSRVYDGLPGEKFTRQTLFCRVVHSRSLSAERESGSAGATCRRSRSDRAKSASSDRLQSVVFQNVGQTVGRSTCLTDVEGVDFQKVGHAGLEPRILTDFLGNISPDRHSEPSCFG